MQALSHIRVAEHVECDKSIQLVESFELQFLEGLLNSALFTLVLDSTALYAKNAYGAGIVSSW